jgi:hypothetical protein
MNEIAKLENGEQVLFDVCFEYGKLVKFITLSDFQKLSLSLEKMCEVDKKE